MSEAKTINVPGKDDKMAFEDFFKTYYPRLTAYGCLFLEPQAAEDVVQDVFLYFWENSQSINIHTSLEAYLFKTVYQRCLNQIKQHKVHNLHHQQISEYLLKFEKQMFDPDSNKSIHKLYMDELKDEIDSAVGTLPEKCRQVFILSYLHDLKNKEICDILGISLSTVENHIYNALKTLRQKLQKHAYLIAILFPLST